MGSENAAPSVSAPGAARGQVGSQGRRRQSKRFADAATLQQAEIDRLKARIAELEEENESLRERLGEVTT